MYKKAFSSCGYLGSVLQKFCKTASIILRTPRVFPISTAHSSPGNLGHRICNARVNAQRIAAIAPAYAFTLAEIMIVLVVIGILTGILVPAAMNSMPNENVMKFKKAHNTLYRVINELVSSDKYYADGDLGIRPNGDLIDGTHSGDYTYFCNSIADVLSAKSVNCSSYLNVNHDAIHYDYDKRSGTVQCYSNDCGNGIAYNDISDYFCKTYANRIGTEITLTDGTVIYQSSPADTYGKPTAWDANLRHYKTSDDSIHLNWYKVLCIDIDGIPTGGSSDCDDEKDICPFAYGISTEGHIIAGERAKQWLNKSIQEKE